VKLASGPDLEDENEGNKNSEINYNDGEDVGMKISELKEREVDLTPIPTPTPTPNPSGLKVLLRYYLLVIYFLSLIFFCTYAFLAGLFGNIWCIFFNILGCNFYK
jgi:hypothetical protein